MTTTMLVLIALSVVVLTAVGVPTLLALKRAAIRAETVLMLLEREIRPTAAQLQALTEELRTLGRHAGDSLERVGMIIGRADEVTSRVARVVGLVAGFTRVGQLVGTASGVKKGLDVFITKLVSRNRKR